MAAVKGTDLHELAAEWVKMKEAEKNAVNRRRKLEDAIVVLLGVSESDEGVRTAEEGDLIIKITSRLNKKVDPEIVQEVAAENGLEDYLPTVFRWKPELNASAWNALSDNIKTVLAKAITVSPSRPTFNISKKD